MTTPCSTPTNQPLYEAAGAASGERINKRRENTSVNNLTSLQRASGKQDFESVSRVALCFQAVRAPFHEHFSKIHNNTSAKIFL